MSTSIDIPYEGGTAVQEVGNAALVAQALEGGAEAFGLIDNSLDEWSSPGLADGLSVAIHSAARATALEVCSKFMGERYPSAECRRWELYQPSMY